VLSRPRVEKPVIDPQRYPVVLVTEEQLNELMRRPSMRQVNRYPRTAYTPVSRWTRWAAAAIVFALVGAVGGLTWFFAPQPAMASFPWAGTPRAPTITTGASFSVTIASLESGDEAGATATRVRAFGLPAFTRRSPGKEQLYQAMVGPYVSLDEAERTQRRLSVMGYRGGRIFVDESLRTTVYEQEPASPAQKDIAALIVGAPERHSFVLELPEEPSQVTSRRTTDAAFDVDVSPLPGPMPAQQWRVPEGVHLLQAVTMEELSAPGGGQYLRARLTLPEFAKANVRNEGRRIYVDLTWPVAEDDVRAPRRAIVEEALEPAAPATAARPGNSRPGSSVRQDEQYRDAIAPIHRRIAEARPFLQSAAKSGSVEVLGALDQTLAAIESSLTSMSVPASAAPQHQLLVAATRSVRDGLAPGFTGDRQEHLQKAFAMFDGAVAPAVPTAVPAATPGLR
jgi:hypothetical protein